MQTILPVYPVMPPIDNHWIVPYGNSSATTSLSGGGNYINHLPLYIASPCQLIEIGCRTTVAAVNPQSIVVGMYAVNQSSNYLPLKIVTPRDKVISLQGATGYKSVAITADLDTGWYWISYGQELAAAGATIIRIPSVPQGYLLPYDTNNPASATTGLQTTGYTYDGVLPDIIDPVAMPTVMLITFGIIRMQAKVRVR